MPRGGRGVYTVLSTFQLKEADSDRLREHCYGHGMTVSDFVRAAVADLPPMPPGEPCRREAAPRLRGSDGERARTTVRFTDEMWRAIDDRAWSTRSTLAEVVRRAVLSALDAATPAAE